MRDQGQMGANVMMKRLLVLIALFAFTILSFQNCGKLSPQMSFSETAKVESDSGHPYEGKIFVLLGALCSDQSNIQSKIVMSSEISAQLVRDNCQDLAVPLKLTSNDFQLDPNDVNKLTYNSKVYTIIGTAFDASQARADIGFAYVLPFDFGTTTDSDASPSVSLLQIYEDGRPLGPAHSAHAAIESQGLGRFSHWTDGLWFSASDNSDPRSNGRVYTYEILQPSDLIVTKISWSPSNPAPGQVVTFSVTIQNIGTGPTQPGVIIGAAFFVDGSNQTWSDNVTSSLAPGATVTITANGGPSGSSTWIATSGAHSIRVSLDDVFRIPESNESNNQLTTTLTIP